MRATFAPCLLFAALPALAQVGLLPAPTDTMENESAAKPRTIEPRATQVNRCADGKGGFVLRDTPCPTLPADAASAVVDITELSSLPPPPVSAAPPPAATDETASQGLFMRGLRHGAWKLALLVLACYVVARLIRAMHARLQLRREFAESQRHGLRRSR
jgi:hypothetical protein